VSVVADAVVETDPRRLERIALGQARVLGARLELADAPDGGALATIDLSIAVARAGA
jgi:hypothetical protein